MTEVTCVVCPKGCQLMVDEENNFQVRGNSCPRGEEYGRAELQNPTRVLTSTVRIADASYQRCPVRTDRPIPKNLVFPAMELLNRAALAAPVAEGQVVVDDILGTGAKWIATRGMEREENSSIRNFQAVS